MLNLFPLLCFVYLMILREGTAQQAYYDDCDGALEEEVCCVRPQEINAASGRICSPYFPDNYIENLHCEWQISSPVSSSVLEIRFEDFSIELSPSCAYDYLEFRNVPQEPNGNDRVLGRFCGETRPEKFVTPSSKVYVIFHSDVNNVCQGFCFTWRSLRATTTMEVTSAANQDDEQQDPGEVICPDANINNGYAECTNANNIRSTCTYSCVFGYTLSGFTTSSCVLQNDAVRAEWVPALPVCLVGLSWGQIALLVLGSLGLLGLLCLCCSAWKRKIIESPETVTEKSVTYPSHSTHRTRTPSFYRHRSSITASNLCTGNPATCPICDSITRS